MLYVDINSEFRKSLKGLKLTSFKKQIKKFFFFFFNNIRRLWIFEYFVECNYIHIYYRLGLVDGRDVNRIMYYVLYVFTHNR